MPPPPPPLDVMNENLFSQPTLILPPCAYLRVRTLEHRCHNSAIATAPLFFICLFPPALRTLAAEKPVASSVGYVVEGITLQQAGGRGGGEATCGVGASTHTEQQTLLPAL